MRVSVVLDDDLVREALRVTGLRTKRALVQEALRVLIAADYEKRLTGYMQLYKKLEPTIARIHVSEPASRIIRRMRETHPRIRR